MAQRETSTRVSQPIRSAAAPHTRSPQARTSEAPAHGARGLGAAAQLAAVHSTLRQGPITQLREEGTANRTGLPDRLKRGVEALSGLSLDSVRVHRNSEKPAALQAHAFTQGSDIHLAPGQERHLPHEAWHVVQQAQGRVRPTMQMKSGLLLNDDAGLEREADLFGARALAGVAAERAPDADLPRSALAPVQRRVSGAVIQAAERNPVYHGAGQATRVTLNLNVGDWPSAGSPPGAASPPGWQQVGALGLPNWVRFHVLNENSGGAGVVNNLVPTRQAVNQVGEWTTFEGHVKGLADPQRRNVGGTPYACVFDATVTYYAAADTCQYRNAAGHVVTVQGAHFPSAIAATFTVPPVAPHGRDTGFAGVVHRADLGAAHGLGRPNQLNVPAGWALVVAAPAAPAVAAPVVAAPGGAAAPAGAAMVL